MKHINLIILSAAAIVAASSCSGVLDLTPTSQYSSETVWNNLESVDHYVYGQYTYFQYSFELNDSNESGLTDCYSDILKSGAWDQYQHSYNSTILLDNSFNSSNAGTFECWSTFYTRIRVANEFLNYAPDHMSDIGEANMKIRIAEVRMMRAFYYYQLIKIYGGVVIRDTLDDPDNNDKVRSSESDSWQFVIDELKAAAEDLPATWASEYRGRFTKAAAYGLLSRCALYAGQWAEVIDAADKCAAAGASLDASYANVFESVTSAENLITMEFVSNKYSHGGDLFFRPLSDALTHSAAPIKAVIGPTSELVDSYEMADGTAFDWSVNGTDPYTGREPRFYASIIYDGCIWEGRDIKTCVADENGEAGYDALQAYKNSGTTTSTPTGYFLRKFITEGATDWEVGGSTHFATMLRYAEVLLNKAEAQAQNGDVDAACTTLNLVRARVSLPGRSTADKDEFMEYLRHERMVELAGEGFRYWDVRRWRLGEDLFHGKACHGVSIVRNGDGTRTCTQVECDGGSVRYFYERYYAFAVPLSERNNNSLFGDNNPGW